MSICPLGQDSYMGHLYSNGTLESSGLNCEVEVERTLTWLETRWPIYIINASNTIKPVSRLNSELFLCYWVNSFLDE